MRRLPILLSAALLAQAHAPSELAQQPNASGRRWLGLLVCPRAGGALCAIDTPGGRLSYSGVQATLLTAQPSPPPAQSNSLGLSGIGLPACPRAGGSLCALDRPGRLSSNTVQASLAAPEVSAAAAVQRNPATVETNPSEASQTNLPASPQVSTAAAQMTPAVTAQTNPTAQANPPAPTKANPAASPQANPAATAQTTPPAAPQEAKPASPPPATTAAAEAPANPVPAPEITVTGWVEFGERFRSGIGGNFDAYRSLIDLGSGPKLLGAEFTITDPKHRFFDEIRVRAYDWGDDPYSTFHLDARKAKLYDFAADYRDIAYFDFLPSYADPLLSTGVMLNEQSFDTRRRFAHFDLNLLPGNWISPYAAYDWDSGSGTGVSTFVTNNDEFPVPTALHDRTANFRGGIRLQLRRFHATLEQGGTRYENSQTLYQSSGVNYGNSLAPVFGQTLDLTDLLGAYGVHGTGIYSKALLTANPISWLDLYGQFMFSEPNTKVNYQQYDGGNLYLQSQILFYTAQQYLVSSSARMPHTSGNLGGEIRPWRRIRITESWMTDRMHNASSAAQNNAILAPLSSSQQTAALLEGSLVSNYNQAEVMLFFDATPRLTLRAGYRYVWGDANDATLPPEGLASADMVHMRRNVGIGGFSYRPLNKISLSAEGESASSGGEYFRTSLWDYQKVRAQARYQPTTSLSVSADFNLLNNQNPQPGVNMDYLASQESLSLFWSPAGGKMFDFEGSYSRSDLRSNIYYLDPGTGQTELSAYRDRAHEATALFHFHLPGAASFKPQLTAGGSFLISSGSRPTSYYQPMAKLSLPIGKHISGFAEWRYYGYGEVFYLYEGFRAHLVTTGLRYTR